MDFVNKLSLENGRAYVAKRDERPRHHKDGQRCVELENVYDKFSGPLRERRLSVERQPGEGIGGGAQIYPGMPLRGRPEVFLPRPCRTGSIEALILGRLRGSGSSCGHVFTVLVCT